MFPTTLEEVFSNLEEIEYVETPSGDVYAFALVSPTGRVLHVVDDDGNKLELSAAEMARVESRVSERRAAA